MARRPVRGRPWAPRRFRRGQPVRQAEPLSLQKPLRCFLAVLRPCAAAWLGQLHAALVRQLGHVRREAPVRDQEPLHVLAAEALEEPVAAADDREGGHRLRRDSVF